MRNIIFALFFAWPVAHFLNLDASSLSRDWFIFCNARCRELRWKIFSFQFNSGNGWQECYCRCSEQHSFQELPHHRAHPLILGKVPLLGRWSKIPNNVPSVPTYIFQESVSPLVDIASILPFFPHINHATTPSPFRLSSPIQPCYNTVYPAFLLTSNHATTPSPSCIYLTMKRIHPIFLHPKPWTPSPFTLPGPFMMPRSNFKFLLAPAMLPPPNHGIAIAALL